MSVPNWQPVGRLMHFPFLSSSGTAVPVYTVAWRIMDQPDTWSHRFIRFKDRTEGDVKGAALVLRGAFQDLIAQLKLDPGRVALTCALSSGVEALDPKCPLARVGKWLSQQLGFTWEPHMFKKHAHRSLHSLKGGAERDAEVSGKYSSVALSGADILIILDDLVTRGATFGEMARAAITATPKLRVIGVALGKNENKSYAEQFGIALDNAHVPAEWDRTWEAARASK